MRLFVTGASGYLGTGLLRRIPKSWTVAAAYLEHPITPQGAAVFRLDVRDAEAVSQTVAAFAPDVVLHTAALMRGDSMSSTNVEGSRNVARAAARVHAGLIHISSDVIFDGEHAPYVEADPPTPITPYGESKALAELAVAGEHPAAAIARTSLIYGFDPIDPHTRRTLNGEMPRLFTDEYRCPIFVDDLADALIELAVSRRPGVLNVAGSQRLSRYEFGLKLAAALHVAPRFQPAESAGSDDVRPRDCALDISSARRLLKTQLRGVDQVLAETHKPVLFSHDS